MTCGRLAHASPSRSAVTRGAPAANGRTRRWTLRELRANDVLGSLPEKVLRVIARPTPTAEFAAGLPGTWLPSADACRRAGWSRNQLMRRIASGEVQALRYYGRWLVEVTPLERAAAL